MIPEYFLRGRVHRLTATVVVPVEFVVGSDDVLDGRTVFGFLQGEGVDQDGLVRDRGCNPLQFGQVAAGCRETLEDDRGLKAPDVELVKWVNDGHLAGTIRIVNRLLLYTSSAHAKAPS